METINGSVMKIKSKFMKVHDTPFHDILNTIACINYGLWRKRSTNDAVNDKFTAQIRAPIIV